LLDSFEQRLKDNLSVTTELQSLAALKEFIEQELLDFRKNEAMAYPSRERAMRFIIGARSIPQSKSALWSTSASRLRPIDDYSLVGFGDERYELAAQSLYRDDVTPVQGIFLGLHIMWLAEQTCNFVKAPVTVVVLRDN
jgi:hypothetical protein